MRLPFIALVYLIGTFLSLRSVAYASALFLWNDIFQPLSFAKSYGAYPTAYYVLGVLLLSFAINFIRGTYRPRTGIFLVCFVILISWIAITVIASPFRQIAITEFVDWLKYLLPLVLIYTGIKTKKDIQIIAATLAGSVAIWGASSGLHTLLHGINIDLSIPGGQMDERNEFAAAIVGTIPILVYFIFSYNGKYPRILKIIFWIVPILCFAAIFMSLSRGASLGFSASLIFYVVMISKRKIRDTSILLGIVAITLLLLPDTWYARMSTIKVGEDQSEASAHQRMGLMIGAWHATLDNPIFGLGPDGWLQVVDIYGDGYHNPHSIYLKLSSETGFIGLALYFALLMLTYIRVMRIVNIARKKNDIDYMRLGIGIVMCIIGLLAAMTFLNRPFHEYLWSWIILANALPEVYAEEKRKEQRFKKHSLNLKNSPEYP